MTRGLAKTKDGSISQDCCPKSLVETLEGKPFNIGFPARSLLVNGTRSAYHASVICSCGAASDEIQIDETSADDGTLPDSRLHQR
jgi:hypothetical protein